jgi:signal peptidase II
MLRLGLVVAAIVALLDQLSKAWMMRLLADGQAIEVAPVLKLVTVWNYGISFGLFNRGSDDGALILVALAVAICVALLIWVYRAHHPLTGVALGLVIGGAVGNVVDRLRFGAVFDFLYFHLGEWYWPAFNLADSAITVGVALLFIESLFVKPRSIK